MEFIMTKTDLLAAIAQFAQTCTPEELKTFREELKDLLKVDRGPGRKEELCEVLNSGTRYTITELAGMMETSSKNISSLLSYLRKDSLKICTDGDGRKFIEQ
jgi:hypothetical protein